MSKRAAKQLLHDASANAHEGEVLKRALAPEFPDRHGQRRYWEACLRCSLDQNALELNLAGPDDWKVYRDLLRHAEHLEDTHPPEPPAVTEPIDFILAQLRQRQARNLQDRLHALGCRLRAENGTLWVGPRHLVQPDDADAIRFYRNELLALVG